MVAIPVDGSDCHNQTKPTYSNSTLVSPCQIVPLIAESAFAPSGVASLQCVSSPPPNCSTITCSVPGSQDYVKFKTEPCYQPPSIDINNYVGGNLMFHTLLSHETKKFNFSASKIPMRVTAVNHTNLMSVGFKVRRQ